MKTIHAFTIHVNADYPEHVDYAFKLAVEYRQKFQRDVMLDIVGYRRLGHNEHDFPNFTQPKIYAKIKEQPKLFEIYGKQLVEERVFTEDEIKSKYQHFEKVLTAEFDAAKKSNKVEPERTPTVWKKYLGSYKDCKQPGGFDTNVPAKKLQELGKAIFTLPKDKNIHHLIEKSYEGRLSAVESGQDIDWGTAESLAFGSLLNEGYGVRLSGEDVRRGTFTQRHACIVDQKDSSHYYPLDNVTKDIDGPYRFKVYNSFLSEYGVVGFDYGYSVGSPDYLTMWEAQFGDFSNCAQPVIDLYLATGETKWALKSGFVMLLPHGLDGQGPEHSSCRVERYLQLVNDDIYNNLFISDDDMQLRLCNFAVCNPSEPANYFHLLRRQIHRDYRKPLVVLTPKRLLRLKEVGLKLILGQEQIVRFLRCQEVQICTTRTQA